MEKSKTNLLSLAISNSNYMALEFTRDEAENFFSELFYGKHHIYRETLKSLVMDGN